MTTAPRAGFDARITEFAQALRAAGVAVGTSELIDALAAVGEVEWSRPGPFQEALAATLAKSPEDREIFQSVFAAFFHRAAEAQAIHREVREHAGVSGRAGAERVELDELREALLAALRDGDDSALRDLARLAIATFGRAGSRSGLPGVDVQRIRRELGLAELSAHGAGAPGQVAGQALRERIRSFEGHLRRELEQAQAERTGSLPPPRPLAELARGLPTGPLQDLSSVHRVVAQLRRRLATQGHQLRGHGRREHVDVRRTMRAALQTGGVPVVLKHRPQRPRRPELYVLCDVSTSVSSASVFFLSVLHALHDSFRRMRSFVFIERISEVTDLFAREKSFAAVSEAIARDAGVADVSGYTDYGRVWREFLSSVHKDLHARATVIVLGDARTNGRDPGVESFGAVARAAGRTFWLNPEPRLYWDHGDSVIGAYAAHCRVHECWTAPQLEEFVKALTRPGAQPAPTAPPAAALAERPRRPAS